MTEDPFASPIISQVLTWIVTLPLLMRFLLYFAKMCLVLFEKEDYVYPEPTMGRRIFLIWVLLCFLLLSPLRYIMLQSLLITAFPFQGFWNLLVSFVLGVYIPPLFLILSTIGCVIPLLLILLITLGARGLIGCPTAQPSRLRLTVAAIAAPLLFLLFSTIYYKILPYAAYTTHWLKTYELISTTNGPSVYFFDFVVEPYTPLLVPEFARDLGWENMSAKERLRAHVAMLYCGEKQYWYYVSKTYPEYFQRLKRNHVDLTR